MLRCDWSFLGREPVVFDLFSTGRRDLLSDGIVVVGRKLPATIFELIVQFLTSAVPVVSRIRPIKLHCQVLDWCPASAIANRYDGSGLNTF